MELAPSLLTRTRNRLPAFPFAHRPGDNPCSHTTSDCSTRYGSPKPIPVLANLMLEQFGGPQGELAAAMRYFTQALAEDDPGRKDMLLDIATEELSHLEVIGTIVVHAEQGRQGRPRRRPDREGELFRSMNGAGSDSQ